MRSTPRAGERSRVAREINSRNRGEVHRWETIVVSSVIDKKNSAFDICVPFLVSCFCVDEIHTRSLSICNDLDTDILSTYYTRTIFVVYRFFLSIYVVFQFIDRKKITRKIKSKTKNYFRISYFLVFMPLYFPPIQRDLNVDAQGRGWGKLSVQLCDVYLSTSEQSTKTKQVIYTPRMVGISADHPRTSILWLLTISLRSLSIHFRLLTFCTSG